MVTFRLVLEVYDTILTSVWFWLAYIVAGLRHAWIEWDEIPEADREEAWGGTTAGAIFVLFLAWPYLWFWRAVRQARGWLEAKGLR